jgi:hypothetical protein
MAFIIYDLRKTNVEQTLNKFINIQPSIKFIIEKEQHEKMNYLDIKIRRKDKRLEFSIYRKPIQTHIIVPNTSCHSYEHKIWGIKYLLNRLYTYPLTKKSNKQKKHYKNILQKNEYRTKLLEKPLSQPQKETMHEDPKHHRTGWATFTYCRKEIRQITKLFKHTKQRVAFRTQNTISNKQYCDVA